MAEATRYRSPVQVKRGVRRQRREGTPKTRQEHHTTTIGHIEDLQDNNAPRQRASKTKDLQDKDTQDKGTQDKDTQDHARPNDWKTLGSVSPQRAPCPHALGTGGGQNGRRCQVARLTIACTRHRGARFVCGRRRLVPLPGAGEAWR